MLAGYIEVAFFLGFLAIWLGFVCLIVPFAVRSIFSRAYLNSLSESNEEIYRRMSELWAQEIPRMGKSRLGRFSQFLLAIGLTILILTFITWLALRIIEKQG
jgi:hypothetical protein